MKEKIKIGFIAENAIGGVAYYILGQIKLLDPKEFECRVHLFNFDWRAVSPAAHIFSEAGIQCSETDVSQEVNKRRLLKQFAEKFLRPLDVIVATSKFELTGYCLARLTNPLVLMVLADTEVNITDVTEFQDIVDRIVPNSSILAEKLETIIRPVNKMKLQYLPQAIPPGFIRNGSVKRADGFRIIFLGRFNSYKGADFLLEIGKRLYQVAPQIGFNIVTNGIGEEAFRNAWSFNATTHYYNNIPNDKLQYLWADSHVMVMPSRNEGMPVALIESMRMGVVPICSNLENGIKELVVPGSTGYLVSVGDIDGFIMAILELYRNSARLRQFSHEAVVLVEAKFDGYECISRFREMYMSIGRHQERTYPRNYSRLGKADLPFFPDSMVRIYRKLKATVLK